MKRLADRRMILLAAATAAVAGVAGAGTARPDIVQITIGFEGGKAIPEGQLVVHLDPAGRPPMAAQASADSDGKTATITLSLPLPPKMDRSSPPQIVSRLQRPDGWLLARGSAQLEGDLPVEVTLYTAMY